MADKIGYIGKDDLPTILDKISQKVVKSTEIREIKIVEEYPAIEEQGVLYMKVLQ